jgi:outer membrane receptor protein involved in Fe transport
MADGWIRVVLSVVVLLMVVSGVPLGVLAQETSETAVQQPGAITGVVVDQKQGEPLPGANVTIKGTTTGTTTDLKGRYRLGGLEPGTYDIVYSFVGFQRKTVTGVEVTAGTSTKIEVTLAEETAQLDEVVIEAEAARDSEAGMLMNRAKAAGVTNAISAETIGRSGAGSAAAAMGNVTGASVVEGKYVNVRGLQGRYVTVQLNGTTLPNADPDGNSVSLDIFPSSLIDNIVTAKTFTPDKPGTFTGGTIDITTKSFPDDFFLDVSVSTSYNSEVGVDGSILRPPGGLEEVPSIADNSLVPSQPFSGTNNPDLQQRNDLLNGLTQAFATNVAPRPEDVLGNRSAEVAFGDRFSVLGGRSLGAIASFTYDESFSGFNGGTTARFSQGLNADRLQPEASYTTRRGVEETLMGGLAGVSFQLTPNNEFGLRLVYNRDEEGIARSETGILPRDNIQGDRRFQTRVSRTIERTVRSAQLSGTHQFSSSGDGVRVEWKTAVSEVGRDEPDNRFFQNEFSPGENDTTYAISGPVTGLPTRYFRDLTEQDWSGDGSVRIPIGSARIEAGGSFRTKTREFRERLFQHDAEAANFEGNPNVYVTEKAGLQEDGRFGTYVKEVPSLGGNYDASLDKGAGYLMVETPVPGLSSLEFIGGARFEYSDMSLNTLDNNTQGSFSQLDVLPSANLVWALREDMNMRVAYGRTIALPSFREFSPFESFNFIGDFTERGNPELNRTSIHNLDLRWEWFPRAGELLSASVYYKAFSDPIERTFLPESVDQGIVTYRNRGSATVYGVELEARKRLDEVAPWLEHMQVGGNLTLTESRIDRTEDVLDLLRRFRDNPDETRQLQGQSPFILNLNAGYDNPETGTSVNVFFNRFGDRLQTVSANGVDIFERARSTLDINASQRLLRGVTVSASVKNVLNSEQVVSQVFKGTEFVNDQRPLGRTVSVGVSYSY